LARQIVGAAEPAATATNERANHYQPFEFWLLLTV
jgi:hypothetical protein